MHMIPYLHVLMMYTSLVLPGSKTKWSLRTSIHMKFSMTGHDKSDLLIQVTAWAGGTVF